MPVSIVYKDYDMNHVSLEIIYQADIFRGF